jgi:hypothetical protein
MSRKGARRAAPAGRFSPTPDKKVETFCDPWKSEILMGTFIQEPWDVGSIFAWVLAKEFDEVGKKGLSSRANCP